MLKPTVVTPSLSFPKLTAYDKNGVVIVFSFSKTTATPALTMIDVAFSNTNSFVITNFLFQVAVPKYLTMQLLPASSAVLAANGGTASQKIQVTNTLHGQKQLLMKIKVDYVKNGSSFSDSGDVSNFPSGL